jgi:hypothetical protein
MKMRGKRRNAKKGGERRKKERRRRGRSGRNGETGRRLGANNEQIFRFAYTIFRIARRMLRFRNESPLQT